MSKVAQVSLPINGRHKSFEVHYSTRSTTFQVRLPSAYFEQTKIEPGAETEAGAIEQARKAIREFEKQNATRRKVILVYNPKRNDGGRFSYNSLDIDVVELRLAFRVVEEVTIEGERNYISDNGRASTFSPEDFAAIEWSAEREAFFAESVERLRKAKAAIREFLTQAEAKPELCDRGSGGIFLTTGETK